MFFGRRLRLARARVQASCGRPRVPACQKLAPARGARPGAPSRAGGPGGTGPAVHGRQSRRRRPDPQHRWGANAL